MIKVLLIEKARLLNSFDYNQFRHNHAISIVESIADTEKAMELLKRNDSQVVVFSMTLPDESLLASIQRLLYKYPKVPVLAFCHSANPNQLHSLLKAGVMGVILSASDIGKIILAIQTLAQGHMYLDPTITLTLLHTCYPVPETSNHRHSLPNGITEREWDVLSLLAQGYTSRQISECLFISRRTVESHRQSLLDKTDCSNTAALIKYALYQGLLV